MIFRLSITPKEKTHEDKLSGSARGCNPALDPRGSLVRYIHKQICGANGLDPSATQRTGEPKHTKEYVLAFLSSLVLVYVLAHFMRYTKATNLVGGLQTAFWLWLGFVATSQIATVIFEGRKPGLYLLNIGYQLVACLVAGGLLAIWKPRAAADPAIQPA